MATRRGFFLSLAVGLVTFGLAVAPALAAELLRGKIKDVDTDQKTISVIPVGQDDDHPGIVVRITAETSIADQNGQRLALEDVRTNNGVAVDHEDGVASKVVVNTGDNNP